MWINLNNFLYISKSKDKNPDENNIALESFLFHGRNLIEFLYYDTDSKNYSRAFHFIKKEDWLKTRPKKTKHISEIMKRASSEVVHLTYSRITGDSPEKQWDCSNTFGDLLKVVKCFLNLLSQKYLGDEIVNLKNNINEVKRI